MPAEDTHSEMEVRDVLDAVAPGRECGECTACCVYLRIEFDDRTKPAGEKCHNLCDGGCSIYPARPSVCRNFYCLWRLIGDIPHELRPDLSGVMATFDALGDKSRSYRAITVRETGEPGSLDKPLARKLVQFFADADRYPVWVSRDGKQRLVHPDPHFVEMVQGKRPVPASLQERVNRWRGYQKA